MKKLADDHVFLKHAKLHSHEHVHQLCISLASRTGRALLSSTGLKITETALMPAPDIRRALLALGYTHGPPRKNKSLLLSPRNKSGKHW